MSSTGRHLTLREVAAELGVSAKTVSNAFTHPDQLSGQLRERVLATASRLGYPGPNPLAAGLRRGRAGAIGVIYANGLSYAFEDPAALELLSGVSSVAQPAGAGLLLVPGSVDPQRSTAAVSSALVDGAIVYSVADDDPVLMAAIARGLPLAVVDQPSPGRLRELGASQTPWIGIDDRAAARSVAEHLLALGHRLLGVISFGLHRQGVRGLADESVQAAATYAVSRRRLAGYRDAAGHAGIDWGAVPVFHGIDSTPAEGEAGAAALLSMTPRPTALICLSDRLAEGALAAITRLGLQVPLDLSLVGFDDGSSATRLGLTTVCQPNRLKGQLAASALLDPMDREEHDAVHTLPTELVIRTSTAQPPANGGRSQ